MQNIKHKHGVISHLDVVFAIKAIKQQMRASKKHGRVPYMSLVTIPAFRVREICKQILSAEGLNLDANAYNFNYSFDEFYNDDLDANFVNGFYLHITPKRGDKVLAVVGHYAAFAKPYKIASSRDNDADLSTLSLPIEM